MRSAFRRALHGASGRTLPVQSTRLQESEKKDIDENGMPDVPSFLSGRCIRKVFVIV